MAELLLILAVPSVWSAPWWASVGAVASVIATLSGVAFNAYRKDKNASAKTISDSAGIFDSSFKAIGKNVRQDILVHHHVVAPETNSVSRSEIKKPSHPSAWEIIDALENATPYDRHHVAGKYEGFEVDWRVEFADMSKDAHDERWFVSFRVSPLSCDEDGRGGHSYSAWVHSYLDIAAFPYLKVAKPGDACWITGKIRSVNGVHVHLEAGAFVEFG